MNKYLFTVQATISLLVEVEAESVAEAVEKAQEAPVMRLCHKCADGQPRGEDAQWRTSGELDCGDPAGFKLINVHTFHPSDFEQVKKLWEGDD
jgi:hypothetical protein